LTRGVRLLFVVFCLLAATGCDQNSPAAPGVPLNERFTLAPGDRVIVGQADLRVEFLRVAGDSRCPADAFCIQGGDALVQIRASSAAAGSREHDLHTGDSSRAAAAHGPARIELVELQPYPFSGRTIRPEEYRATLRVTR
jgi:hypothetical protein